MPARSVIRDPETQVIVTREKALQMEWKKVFPINTIWGLTIENIIEWNFPDQVLVAPKRHPRFEDYLDGLKKLCDIGVAEPD